MRGCDAVWVLNILLTHFSSVVADKPRATHVLLCTITYYHVLSQTHSAAKQILSNTCLTIYAHLHNKIMKRQYFIHLVI